MLSVDKIYQSKSNFDSIFSKLFNDELIKTEGLSSVSYNSSKTYGKVSYSFVNAGIIKDVDTNKKYLQINILKTVDVLMTNYYEAQILSVNVNIDNPKEVHVFQLPILFKGWIIPSRMQNVMKEILVNDTFKLDFILLEHLLTPIGKLFSYANPEVVSQFYSSEVVQFAELIAQAYLWTYDDIQELNASNKDSDKVYSFSDNELDVPYNPFLKVNIQSQIDTTINPEYILDLTTAYLRNVDNSIVDELLFDRYESIIIPIRFETEGIYSSLSGFVFDNINDFVNLAQKYPEVFNLRETDFETIVLEAIHVLNYFTGNDKLDLVNTISQKQLSFTTDYINYSQLLNQNGCGHLVDELVSERSVNDTVDINIIEYKGLYGFSLNLNGLSAIGYLTTQPDIFDGTFTYSKSIDLKPIFYAIQKAGSYDIYANKLTINIVSKDLDLSYLKEFNRYVKLIYPFSIDDITLTPGEYDIIQLFIQNVPLEQYLNTNFSTKYVETIEYDNIKLKYDYLIIPDDIKNVSIDNPSDRFKLTPVLFVPKKNYQSLLEEMFYNPPSFEKIKEYYDIYVGNILPIGYFGENSSKFYIPVLSVDSFQKLIDMSGIDFLFSFDSSKLIEGYDFIAEVNKLIDLPIPEAELFKSLFKTLTNTLQTYNNAAVILGIYDVEQDEIIGLIRLPFEIKPYQFINPIKDYYQTNKLLNLFTYEQNPTPDTVSFGFKLGAILDKPNDFFKIHKLIVNRVAEIQGSISELKISGYTVNGDYTTITYTADDLTNSFDESIRAYVLDISDYNFVNEIEISGQYIKRPVSFEYYDRIQFNIESQIPEVDSNSYTILTFKNSYIPYQVFQSLADFDSESTDKTSDSLADVEVVKNKLFLEYTISVNPKEDLLIAGKTSTYTVYPEVFYFKHLLDKLPDNKLCVVLNGFITNDTTAYIDYTSLTNTDQTVLANIVDTIAFVNFADVLNGKVNTDSDVDYILPVFDQSSQLFNKPFQLIVKLHDDLDWNEIFAELKLVNRFDPGKSDIEYGKLAILAEGIVNDFDGSNVEFSKLLKFYKLALIGVVKSEIPKSLYQPIHLTLESYVDGTLVASKDVYVQFYILSRADLFSTEVSFRPQILRFLDIQDNDTGIYFVDIVEKLNNESDTSIAKLDQILYDIVVATEDILVGIPTDLTTYNKVDDLVDALVNINNLQFISLTDRDNQKELQRLINYLHDLLGREYPNIPEFKYSLTVKITPKYYGLNDAAFSLNSYVYNLKNFVRIPYIVYDSQIETIQLLNTNTEVKYGPVKEVMPDAFDSIYQLLATYSESDIYKMLNNWNVPYKSVGRITILNSSKQPNYLILRLAYNDSGLNNERIDNTEVVFEVSPFEYATYYIWQTYTFADITSSEGGFLVYDIIYKNSQTGSETVLGQIKLPVPQFDFYANYLFNILNRVNLTEAGVITYQAATTNYKNYTLEQTPVRKTYLDVDYQIDAPNEVYLNAEGGAIIPIKVFGSIVLNDQIIKKIIEYYGSLDYLKEKYLHIPFSMDTIDDQIGINLPEHYKVFPVKLYPLTPNKLTFEGEVDIPITGSYVDVYKKLSAELFIVFSNIPSIIQSVFGDISLADTSSLEALKELIKPYQNYDMTVQTNIGIGNGVNVSIYRLPLMDNAANIITYEPKTLDVKVKLEYENYPAFIDIPGITKPCDCYYKYWYNWLDVEPFSDLTISATFVSQLPEYEVPMSIQLNNNIYPNPTLTNVPENILQIKSIQNPNLNLTDLINSELKLKVLDNRLDVRLKVYGDVDYYKFTLGVNDNQIKTENFDLCKLLALSCRRQLIESSDYVKFFILGLNPENISEKERRFETEVNQQTVLIMNPNRTILGVIPIAILKEIDSEITLSHFTVLTDYPDEIFIVANWYLDNIVRIDNLNQNLSPELVADFAFRNPPAYQTFGKNQLAIDSGFTILKEFKGSGIIGFILLSSKLQYSGSYNLMIDLEYSVNGQIKNERQTYNIQVIPPNVLDNNKITAVLRRIDVPTYFNFRRMEAGVSDWFTLYITGKLNEPQLKELKGLKGAKGMHGLY